MSVCAVVVTHNRRELLSECLAAIHEQTQRPDHVLVVDNASTDGTAATVRQGFPDVELIVLATNEGGAGGFHEGMKAALGHGYEWLWVMDDDTIPNGDALEILLEARGAFDAPPALLASKILWTDGKLHPMNWPEPALGDFDRFVGGLEQGLMPIRSTTFPSLLIRRDAVEKYGLPRKGFFIWADDIDFTQRVLRHEQGYLIPRSVAVHKTRTAHKPWEGGERFYYAVRNGLFILRGDSLAPKEKVSWLLVWASQVQRFFGREGLKWWALKVVGQGLRDGLLKPPP